MTSNNNDSVSALLFIWFQAIQIFAYLPAKDTFCRSKAMQIISILTVYLQVEPSCVVALVF